MSSSKNKNQDIENTKKMMLNLPVSCYGSKNWLEHEGACERIDQMLLVGATLQDLSKSGRKINSIRSHLNHLKSIHGLSISKVNGVYRFDYPTTQEKNADIVEKRPLKIHSNSKSNRDLENIKHEYNERLKQITGTERESIVSQRIG